MKPSSMLLNLILIYSLGYDPVICTHGVVGMASLAGSVGGNLLSVGNKEVFSLLNADGDMYSAGNILAESRTRKDQDRKDPLM